MLFYTFNILLFHICIFIFIFRYLSSSILSCGIRALPSRPSIFPRSRQPPASHATPRYYSHSTPGSQVRQIKVSQLIKSPSPESRVIIDYNLSGKIVNNVRLGLRAWLIFPFPNLSMSRNLLRLLCLYTACMPFTVSCSDPSWVELSHWVRNNDLRS